MRFDKRTSLEQAQLQYDTTEAKLAQLYLTEHKRTEVIKAVKEHKKQTPTIKIHKLALLECTEITSHAYQRIMTFRESTERFPSGMSVFGWRDLYHYENGDLSFSLEKTFRYQSVHTVADKMWGLVNNCEAFGQLFPSGMNATFHPVQHLDNNNTVYFLTQEFKTKPQIRDKMVLLCSRLSVVDDDGCVMVFRSLNPHVYVVSEGERERRSYRRGRYEVEP